METKDKTIQGPNNTLPQRGTPNLHFQRHRILHQMQTRTRSTQSFVDPIPFTKFIKMADQLSTEGTKEIKNKKDAIHRDQPHQGAPNCGTPKNLWSASGQDQELDVVINKTDLTAPELDQSSFDPSLEEHNAMDGINLMPRLQKPQLNPHRLKSHKFHQLILKQTGADLLRNVKKKKKKAMMMKMRCNQMTLVTKRLSPNTSPWMRIGESLPRRLLMIPLGL